MSIHKPVDMSSFSMEMIEFQKDNFGKDLEALLTKIRTLVIDPNFEYKTIIKTKELEGIKKLIKSRLGLTIKFVTNSAPAAIMPFYPGPNHVFMPKIFKGDLVIPDQRTFINKNKGVKGTVDLKNAKVGGMFSEYEVKLYMNFKTLFIDLKASPGEVTAIMLHEMGHAFYACSFADRVDTTNQILSEIVKNLSGKKDLEVSIVYRELEKINPNITEKEIDDIVNGTRVIAGPRLAKIVFEGFRHQLKDDTYDQTSFEALADNFASRFNYGRELVSGLDKLGEYFGAPERDESMRFYLYFMQVMGLAVLATYIFLFFSVSIPAIMILGIIITLIIYSHGEKMKDYTYDDLRIRYNRIRQDAINQIKVLLEKDDGTSKEQLKEILSSIENTDKIISGLKDFNLMFYNLSNFIFPSNRKARNSVKEQQLLEQLASNDLFLKAATLKTIS